MLFIKAERMRVLLALGCVAVIKKQIQIQNSNISKHLFVLSSSFVQLSFTMGNRLTLPCIAAAIHQRPNKYERASFPSRRTENTEKKTYQPKPNQILIIIFST